MDGFRRHALYVVPEGPLYAAGAAWLGWDSAAGAELVRPAVPGLSQAAGGLTEAPRKYGFHGTIKPPFFLPEGAHPADLNRAARAFCAARAPVVLPSMAVRRLGRFIAIVPDRPSAELDALAAAAVAALDRFRAPPSEAERARRRAANPTERQEAMLRQWGYPYVMDEFRFHLTLTGPVAPGARDTALVALAAHFAPYLTGPVTIGSLCLMGEDVAGRFHVIARHALSGGGV